MIRHILFLILAALVAIAPPAAADSPVSTTSTVTLDISQLTPFLATLTPDEQDEQLRDWARFGLMSGSATKTGEIPVRHPALKGKESWEVAAGRVFPLSPREWGVLVPEHSLGNRALIGGLVDGRRVTTRTVPQRISLFGYTHDPAAATIRITPAGGVESRELFTPAYGYHGATVRTLAEFVDFIGRIDDLVTARWRGEALHLEGRTYGEGRSRSLSLEEIAAIYQAYNPDDAQERRAYEEFLERRFETTLRRDRKLRRALERGTITRSAVMGKIRRRYPPAPRKEANVGFSLDPQKDYVTLAADLEHLLQRGGAAGSAIFSPAIAAHAREIQSATERILAGRDVRPLLSLRRRLQQSADPRERNLAEILHSLEMKNSYQAARYDGPLQGTEAAMTLFYTDLLAKLWVLDYAGMTPKGAVKGMRTMQEISVPKMWWDDMEKNSQTRLWFGLRQDGFALDADNLLFKPVATRVYAASSDPLSPGKEGVPNYQSREFLGWWDSHYGAVADHEPSYHKLNQIQKWSTLFLVLREKRAPFLEYLHTVPVTRSLDFSAWSRREGRLGVRPPFSFLDGRRFGRSTECLPLLSSRDYRMMGKTYALSGGVSLASRQDILARMREPAPVEGEAATPAAAGGAPAAQGGRSGPVARGAGSVNRSPGEPKRKTEPGRPATGRGAFHAERRGGIVRLTWEKGAVVAMNDFVATLAARQQSDPGNSRGEGVFTGLPEAPSVVTVTQGRVYLVKTPATGDRWIYLAINPPDLKGYPASAAADHPEADIFGARLVTAAEARKIAPHPLP